MTLGKNGTGGLVVVLVVVPKGRKIMPNPALRKRKWTGFLMLMPGSPDSFVCRLLMRRVVFLVCLTVPCLQRGRGSVYSVTGWAEATGNMRSG